MFFVIQDAYLVRENLCGDSQLSVYGVFDGHGEFGELVSGYCRDHLPTFLENEPNLKTDPVQALLSGTAAMCAALARTAINRQFSGTTAVYGACACMSPLCFACSVFCVCVCVCVPIFVMRSMQRWQNRYI